jgi:DNA-binding transcriptional LysR family regulator
MPPKRRNLPSLSALATFEIAAKHLSFTLAAAELHITQGAISQQIRGLEKTLGTPLFNRLHNTLALTPSGEQLLQSVIRGLDDISHAVELIAHPATDAPVITCAGTHAAIACWLQPYIDRFRVQHPTLRCVLLVSDEDDTLRNFDEVDISILCGNERCDVGEQLFYLFPECVEPVCSPAYLREHGALDAPQSLSSARLLALHRKHWASDAIGWRPLTWEDWFRANDVALPPPPATLVSNHYPLLLQAALNGDGVLLGWQHLVEAQVAAGRLCRPFARPLCVERGYYLKQNAHSADKPGVRSFIDFVLSDLRDSGLTAPAPTIAAG